MVEVIYAGYAHYLQNQLDINNFKRNIHYIDILEHVNDVQGTQYYKLIVKEIKLTKDQIVEFCRLNDSIGNPMKYTIEGFECSPTSLRYLYHACLIVKYMNTSDTKMIELGGGYGGLCLAIDYVAKIMNTKLLSYDIIDLDPAVELQKQYLSNFTLQFPVYYHSSSTYGSNAVGDFLVSNYCFSEISAQHQRKYMDILLPKISKGFMTWNHIPLFDFGKDFLKIQEEKPQTGSNNLFIYF